jgi:hypothetical protein
VGAGTVTVTLQVAVLLPSAVVTVIVADPAATAVTRPPADTVAVEALLLAHVTFWFVAPDGVMAGTRYSEPPASRLADDLFRVTPVTATAVALTFTVQAAVLLPSAVLTVMVAVPAATAVTVPLDDTVATEALPLLHVTLLFAALDGSITAERVSVPPTTRLVVDLRETPVTAMLVGGVGVVGVLPPPPPPPRPPKRSQDAIVNTSVTASIANKILLLFIEKLLCANRWVRINLIREGKFLYC